jgi:transcriptional regulator with XRE-family HTH domain
MRESEEVAALRVVLGKSLAGHRERNGLKQSELAERLYYDRTSISKIETGQQPAPQAFWCAADELLDADGELVAMFDALTAAKAAAGQADRQTEGRLGDQPADVLAGALAAVILPVARSSNRVRSTSACVDQVDTVIELEALSRALAEHSRRVLMGEPVDWAAITERLNAAALTCRHRVVVEPCVAGDTGRN